MRNNAWRRRVIAFGAGHLPDVNISSESSIRHRVTVQPDWYEPYAISLGIRVGDLVFVSGQAAVDEHGRTVGEGDFEAQARRAFANLATVLDAAGSGLEHVVSPSWSRT